MCMVLADSTGLPGDTKGSRRARFHIPATISGTTPTSTFSTVSSSIPAIDSSATHSSSTSNIIFASAAPATRETAGLCASDPRWVLAVRTAHYLDAGRAGLLAPDKRDHLIKTAQHLGIRPFDDPGPPNIAPNRSPTPVPDGLDDLVRQLVSAVLLEQAENRVYAAQAVLKNIVEQVGCV